MRSTLPSAAVAAALPAGRRAHASSSAAAAPLSSAHVLCSLRAAKLAPPAGRGRMAAVAASRTVAAVEVAAAPSGGGALEKLRFMSPADAEAVREKFGTPTYVYDADTLKRQARVRVRCAAAACGRACGATNPNNARTPRMSRAPAGPGGARVPQRVRRDRALRHEEQP
jgi:hypothetical protein